MPNISDYIAMRNAPKNIFDYTPAQRAKAERLALEKEQNDRGTAQRNKIAELLNNRSKQISNRSSDLANTNTALDMAQFGNPTYNKPIELDDGTYGQPKYDRTGKFVGFEKMPGYTPKPAAPKYSTKTQTAVDMADLQGLQKGTPEYSKFIVNYLKTNGKLDAATAPVPTFYEKEEIKKDATRRAKLKSTKALRKTSLDQAKRFLGAFKGEKNDLKYFNMDEGDTADSGQTQTIIDMLPGRFTAQSQFNEELDAFAEQAARQLLEAAGEVRPTDADVEGAKRALFGVGKDEITNINLLQKYIEEQESLESDFADLNAMDLGGSRFTIEEI